MRLTTVILIASLMQLSAATFGQRISLDKQNIPLKSVLRELTRQSGFGFFYDGKVIGDNQKVNVQLADVELDVALKSVLSGLKLSYSIDGKIVSIKKLEEPSFFENLLARFQAIDVKGKIVDENGQPLAGATVRIKGTERVTRTGDNGAFTLSNVDEDAVLEISYLGYKMRETKVAKDLGSVSMEISSGELTEVNVTYNTGYQEISKERATGSFTQVSNDLINRSVSPNILDRLEDLTSGLQFDRRNLSEENSTGKQPEIRIRGLSTIAGEAAPLIIVDNFPYRGDISSINPNDIESITILKDAAAASIWGARAGNGVIVINTKQGHFNQQTQVSLNSNINLTSKPDLFYDKNFLPAATTMAIQQEMFSRSAYTEDDKAYVPAYVELLIKHRDNKISPEDFLSQKSSMEQADLRNEASKYLYQIGITQQYALNVNGGVSKYRYYFSAGYDNNKGNVTGKSNDRLNLGFQNTFKLGQSLEISGSMWFTLQNAANNSITYSSIGNGVREPYTLLADESGNSLPAGYFGRRQKYTEQAIANGLLDWQYRPLDELKLADNTSGSNEVRANFGFKYNFLKHLNFNTTYQYLRGSTEAQSFYDSGSYYVRSQVNRFTQANGQLIIPNGGILEGQPSAKYQGHSGRLQLNYNQVVGKHQLNALAGTEIAQRINQQSPGFRIYNYSKELTGGTQTFDYTKSYPVRPSGSALIPAPPIASNINNDRNLSYFSNAAYSYNSRYTASASARWDGSNLLGVKTNQRGTLLWSTGIAWEISKENFYTYNLIRYLKLRATYGSGGLIDKSQSQYPTISLTTDAKTGLPMANLSHPGNPSLQWEQVNTLNLGLDWASKNNRFSGSLEGYNKAAKNLLGSILIDPTTGAGANYKRNYANLTTKGFDLQLNSVNINSPIKWESNLLISYTTNKITNYSTPSLKFVYDYFNGLSTPPVAGRSADAFYALPWNGLDHQTGLPVIYIDGKTVTDYEAYIVNYKPENLILAGVDVPPVFGSIRNTFSWRGLQLSALISFKTGYIFRRNSMEPGAEYDNSTPLVHVDYFERWKQPGDELHTNVPARINAFNSYIGTSYSQSMALITSGDHIRLQDINLAYNVPAKILSALNIKQVRFYINARNLGIISRKNKNGIDPDYPSSTFPAPKTIAFGLQASL